VKALECARFRVAVMFPEDVIGEEPIVKLLCASVRPTEVTVPAFCVRHVPLTEKHPPLSEIPFANVEVAVVPVTERNGVDSPEAMVDVALDKIVEVAVPFCETERTVVEALARIVRPVPIKPEIVGDVARTSEPVPV
jgi:hypothetical protein